MKLTTNNMNLKIQEVKNEKTTFYIFLVITLLTISSCKGNKEIKPYLESSFTHINNDNAEYYYSSQNKESTINEVIEYNNSIIEFFSINEKSVFVIQDLSSKIDYIIEDTSIDVIDIDIKYNEVDPYVYSLDHLFFF